MQGFRFIQRAGKFTWVHQSDLRAGDVDCTDMDDDAFEAQVCLAAGVFSFATVPA